MNNKALTSEEIREKDKTVDAISNFEWSYEQFNKRMRSLYPDGYNQHRVVTRKDILGDDFYYPANINQLFKVPKLSTK